MVNFGGGGGGGADLGTATLKLRTDNSGLDKGLNDAEGRSKGFVRRFTGIIGPAGLALGAVGVAGAGLGAALGFGFNKMREQAEISFGVLLGSAEAAEERMDELAKFAATTPFELGGVVEASRILQTFTGDALSTGEGLKMVGDIAAGTTRPFEEVALWVGRMYDSLQSGRPVGEAMARLQEMGAISGEARARIEELAASGKSIDEIWPLVSEEFEQFNGLMDAQSRSFDGLMATLQDTLQQTMGTITGPLFERASRGLQRLVEATSTPEFEAFAERMAANIEAAFVGIANTVGTVIGAVQDVIEVLGWLRNYLRLVAKDGDELNDWLEWLPGWLQPVALGMAFVVEEAQRLRDRIIELTDRAMPVLRGGLDLVRATVEALLPHLQTLGRWFLDHPQVIAGVALAIGTLIAPWATLTAVVGGVILKWDELVGRVPVVGAAFDAVAEAVRGLSEWVQGRLLPSLDEGVEKFRNDVLPALENVTKAFGMVMAVALAPFILAVRAVWSAVSDNFGQIQATVRDAMRVVQEVIEFAVEFVRDTFSILFAILRGDWADAWTGVQTLVSNVFENLQEVVRAGVAFIVDAAGLAWDMFRDGVDQLGADVIAIFEGFLNGVLDFIRGLAGMFVDAASALGRAIVEGIVNGIKSMPGAIGSAIADMVPDSVPLPGGLPSVPLNPMDWGIPGFADGGVVDAPLGDPVLAVVHGGERIIPAGENSMGGQFTVVQHFHDRREAAVRDAVVQAGYELSRQFQFGGA